jgi:hypothetical protein
VPGTSVKLGLFRDAQSKTIIVILGEFPRTSADVEAEEREAISKTPVLGLILVPASSPARVGDRRVVIAEINPGDVILDVGLQAVNTPAGPEIGRMRRHPHIGRFGQSQNLPN